MKKTGNSKSGAKKQAFSKVKPPTYQPSKQELNQPFDMPGASMETMKRAVFQPLNAKGRDKPNN
ncbi:MAG: hypothetical protein F4221_00805 [Rhodothermaceae bacterium]|nr:hypothetical protein [Rhodothermaceae bacterium]